MRQKLLILPSDHRSSLARDLLGVTGKLTGSQKRKMMVFRDMVYRGEIKTVKQHSSLEEFGVLFDEEFGSKVIKKAKRLGVVVAVPVEASGHSELIFEYGDKFGQHIKKVNPDYVKVLIRYNPSNKSVNRKQLEKIRKLDKFCRKNNYSVMLELLVPATDNDLKKAGSQEAYDKKLRLEKSIKAIYELRENIKVEIWKLEWFSKSGWNKICKVIGEDERMIMLGRGGNKQQVKQWLIDATSCKKVIGFAIGRTIFLQSLKDYVSGKFTKRQAIDKIADNFGFFVKVWNSKRG